MLALTFCLALMTAMVFGCATALKETATAEAQADWKFHDIVDVDFVKQYAKVPMAENVMIIDARPKRAKYDKGHIPMAVSIPNTQFDKMVDKLPKDKNALLIYYCGGLKCKLSHKSAWKAEKLGYKNVKVFAEGFPAWMKVSGNYPSVSVEWVKKQIDNNADMVLIDSRPKRKKFDKGHIPTAVSIPDSQFDKLKDQLPKDKNKPLVFYCGGFKCKLSHKSAKKKEPPGSVETLAHRHRRLPQRRPHEHVPAVDQRDDQCPQHHPAFRLGIDEVPHPPEVDLRLLRRLRVVDPYRPFLLVPPQLRDCVPAQRRVAPAQAFAFQQSVDLGQPKRTVSLQPGLNLHLVLGDL